MELSFGWRCGSRLERFGFDCSGLWGWRVKAMFKESSDVSLDGFKLVELQIGVNDGENVPGGWVLVNENALAIAHNLLFDLEEALAFEHDGEDVAGGYVVRIVELNELSQKGLGVFFMNRFVWRRGRVVNAVPI